MKPDRRAPTRGRDLAKALGLPKPKIAAQSKRCHKRAYPDYDAALTAAIHRRAPYPLRIYLCPGCGAHHLTKRPTHPGTNQG